MNYFFRAVARNLAAGARLAFLGPRLTREAFRLELAQLLALMLLSALIDVGTDWLRSESAAQFSWLGVQGELFAFGLLVFTSTAFAAAWRDAALYLALPVIVLAGVVVVQVVHAIPLIFPDALGSDGRNAVELIVFAWMALVCMRAVYIALGAPAPHRRVRSVAGGLLLIIPLWLAPLLGPLEPWWRGVAEDSPIASPASEMVLATQDFLMDHVLDNLEEEREGVTDLYFVGFAPDSRHDGFRIDVQAAQSAMDERWGTSRRSLLLINNPNTVAEVPFATVTYLRKVLVELGDVIDTDDDVVMIYLAGSSDAGHALRASNPPLDLVSLTPVGLRQLLNDAGIRYRVVVVSACYSGGWVEALSDDDTVVLASSASDAHGEGCEGSATPTPFGAHLFGTALAGAATLGDALEQAPRTLATQGVAMPVLWMGRNAGAKLRTLGKHGGGQTVARAAATEALDFHARPAASRE